MINLHSMVAPDRKITIHSGDTKINNSHTSTTETSNPVTRGWDWMMGKDKKQLMELMNLRSNETPEESARRLVAANKRLPIV